MTGTSKIRLTSFSTLDTNNFWDTFKNEIILIAYFITTCFSWTATVCVKVFSWVSNLNLSKSLLKNEDIVEVNDQNLLHATLLKAVFSLPEEFQCNISTQKYHKYIWQTYQLLEKKFEGGVPEL